jgi:hypothetical protein
MTRRVNLGHLAPAVLLLAGCLHHAHTDQQHAAGDPADLVRAMPQPVKNRVHVLFVHGYDPFGPLGDLRQECIDAGLIKTYAAGPLRASELWDLAFESFQREPDARFVLVGHAAGCGALPHLAVRMQAHNMPVVLAICIDGTGHAAPDAVHFVPADKCHAREVLFRELHEIAQQIAVVEVGKGLPPGPDGEWGFLRCDGPPAPRGLPIVEAREMSPGPGE